MVSMESGLSGRSGSGFQPNGYFFRSPSSPVVDDIEITIPPCDLYISYLRHPDIAMELIKTGVPVLLGINLGPGFMTQAGEYNQAVIGPETMCSVLPDTKFWQINEYARVFGRPVFHIILDSNRVVWCHPIRGSPCGSTTAAAHELNGQEFDQEALNRFALSGLSFLPGPPVREDL